MPRWFYALLLFAPAALIAKLLALPQALIFALSAISIIPYAVLISRATESLAAHLGPGFGGLLNATFGNSAEVIISAFAIRSGLLTLVKASITGSIVTNTLLILGISLLAGGIRHGRQRFNASTTSITVAMMTLAIAGLYLPAIFAASVPDRSRIEELSLFVAGVLLLTYIIFLVYTLLHRRSSMASESEQVMVAGRETGATRGPAEESARATPAPDEGAWSTGKAFLVLGGCVVGIAISSEILVGAIEYVTRELGLNELFVGIIIVPVIGNAAEFVSAVQMAWRDRLDVTLPIAAGSSTQIALLVAPLLVFLSHPLGHPLDLIFTPLELGVLGLVVVIFSQISRDGESNWLEGAQLLALFVLAGLAFFFLPLQYE